MGRGDYSQSIDGCIRERLRSHVGSAAHRTEAASMVLTLAEAEPAAEHRDPYDWTQDWLMRSKGLEALRHVAIAMLKIGGGPIIARARLPI
jgi:hypothetical protein